MDEEEEEEVFTETMGELYARQGLFDRAVEVFEYLVVDRPDEPRFEERLAELQERAAGGAPAVGAAAPAEGEEAVEKLAREMSSGEGAAGALDTPFAWEEDEEEAASAPHDEEAGGLISDYFARLLAWEPEGHTGTPVPGAAAGAVPIESLAPDGEAAPAGAGAVPIESLAPGGEAAPTAAGAVPIESLAPDEPDSADGASDAVPIESLAPDAESPGGGGDDDFDHWLDRLK